MPEGTRNPAPKGLVVADTSALISLGVGKMLAKCVDIVKIVIPSRVNTELIETSAFDDRHGQAAIEVIHLIAKGQIEVLSVQGPEKVEKLCSSSSRIDRGEAEALVLAQERSAPILITDDFRSLPALKKVSGQVEVHLSVYLLARLVLEGRITIAEAQVVLDKISQNRSWEASAIYQLAKRYITDLL